MSSLQPNPKQIIIDDENSWMDYWEFVYRGPHSSILYQLLLSAELKKTCSPSQMALLTEIKYLRKELTARHYTIKL